MYLVPGYCRYFHASMLLACY